MRHAQSRPSPIDYGACVRQGQASPTPGPLLLNHELVRSSEEDLRWQIPALFAAQGAIYRYGLKGELSDARRHIAVTSLTPDNECLAARGCREHASIIGYWIGESSEHRHTCHSGQKEGARC